MSVSAHTMSTHEVMQRVINKCFYNATWTRAPETDRWIIYRVLVVLVDLGIEV